MSRLEGPRGASIVRSPLRAAALEIVACCVACAALLLAPPTSEMSVPEFEKGLFFCLLVLVLGHFVVPLQHGHLRLTTLGTQAAAMSLRPGLTLVVALLASLPLVPYLPTGYRFSGLGLRLLWVTAPAVGAYALRSHFSWGSWASPLIVIVGMTALNWMLTLANIGYLTGQRLREVTVGTFNTSFLAVFAYFGLASFLMAAILDGTLRGYLLASILAVLSITLTKTIKEQRRRQLAEAQLVDVERHSAYRRAVAGLAHNLRNTLSVNKGYLEDLEELATSAETAGRLAGAKRAADEALGNLARWSEAANPNLAIAAVDVDLAAVAEERLDAVRSRASRNGIAMDLLHESAACRVRADPLLIGDVISNLLLNAIDAVGGRGRIQVSVGRERGGFVTLSVADSGPGVAKEQRDRLFEPDFTTKPSGSGIGLFTSFGIVRQHGGELRYESGAQRGAIFTIRLPASSPPTSEPITEAGDGLNPTAVSKRLSRGVDRLVD